MEITNLTVGNAFSPTYGKPEGVYADTDASGILVVYNFTHSTQSEVEQMGAEKPFEIRSARVGDALYILTKCGELNWMDAPYNPHLSRQMGLRPITNDIEGYALTLLMVDAVTNIIKSIRLIGLGNEFSKTLKNEIDELQAKSFSQEQYNQMLHDNNISFSTTDLVKLSDNYWRLK